MNNTDIDITIETITPKKAAEYLDRNIQKNRRIYPAKVNEYAAAMANGTFHLIPASVISFDKNGNLYDGQHRLYACIQSGCSFKSFVARNADPDSYKYTDIGKARSAADLYDGRNSKRVTTLAKSAFATKYGNLKLDNSFSGTIRYTYKKRRTFPEYVSPPVIAMEAEQHQELYDDCCEFGRRLSAALGESASNSYSYFVWLMKWLDMDDTLKSFIDTVCDEQTTNNVILMFKTKYLVELHSKIKRSRLWVIGALFYMYNSFKTNTPPSSRFNKNVDSSLKRLEQKIQEKREVINA